MGLRRRDGHLPRGGWACDGPQRRRVRHHRAARAVRESQRRHETRGGAGEDTRRPGGTESAVRGLSVRVLVFCSECRRRARCDVHRTQHSGAFDERVLSVRLRSRVSSSRLPARVFFFTRFSRGAASRRRRRSRARR